MRKGYWPVLSPVSKISRNSVKDQVTPDRQASPETRQDLVPPAGIEPATHGLGNDVGMRRCALCAASIHILSTGALLCHCPVQKDHPRKINHVLKGDRRGLAGRRNDVHSWSPNRKESRTEGAILRERTSSWLAVLGLPHRSHDSPLAAGALEGRARRQKRREEPRWTFA